MKKIAALDSGTAFHIVSLHGKPFNKFFSKVIYLPELRFEDLEDMDILLVTCSSSVEQILKHKEIFYEFLKCKKTLVVMGRNGVDLWLKDVKSAKLPFNYWWWLNKNAKTELIPSDISHPFFKFIDFKDMIWHFHGGFELPKNAVSIVEHGSLKKSVFFELKEYYGGDLVVTSLDPFYHHGSFFMPNATKFGKAILTYLKQR